MLISKGMERYRSGFTAYIYRVDTTLTSDTLKHIHFIAIGGAAMHNLALALHENGNRVTGSDDEIKEPSLSRLQNAGLLPDSIGWYPEKLDARPDVVILGMHARADNPELLRAVELSLKVMSFPEFLYEHSTNKKRVVIGGSHGKTTITSMVMHVLREAQVDFDYMVGSTVQGFTTMVRLTHTAPVIILEGDEYLSSPIDRRPKFHLYQADIGLISGIAWDHINVFPTFENYVEQFRIFAAGIPTTGSLIYFNEDESLATIVNDLKARIPTISYGVPKYRIENGVSIVEVDGTAMPVAVFGKHNLANLEAARNVCGLLGVKPIDFYRFAQSFKGAGRRLEMVGEDSNRTLFRDFAHSPSKLKATISAVREQYPDRKLVACFELHTFSSLSDGFLDQYAGTMSEADVAIVYFNPEVIAHKKVKPISADRVRHSFKKPGLMVFTNPDDLNQFLLSQFNPSSVMTMMSSGTFDGIDLSGLLKQNPLSQ
ncbi:MAG: UDP-N-acetylmuramate--L-alanine ligase [Bacteroidia bacterium]